MGLFQNQNNIYRVHAEQLKLQPMTVPSYYICD